ncbi:hypothetical protein Tco_1515627 [Tanacetum coccineum]
MNSSTIVSEIHPTKFKWTEKTVPVAEGIDNDIYSTVDACQNAYEMWKVIKRLKQGESINFQDIETNLYWEFGKFISRDGESLESYYSRFYKMMNELVRNQCDVIDHQGQELKTVSYHKLYDILKQHHNKVNKIRAERLASATRNRGKAIVNSPPPTYDQEPEMVTENDALSTEKEIDKPVALISLSFKKIFKPTNNNLKTSSNTSRENQDNTLRINRGTEYNSQRDVNVVGSRENVARECQKPKQVKGAAHHKEKMLLFKKEEARIQLNAEHTNWRDDSDDETNDQELEAHYMYMAQIQEVTSNDADNSGPIFDTQPFQKEQGDTNITINSLDMRTNGETVDQDDDDLARERDLLASLIDKLKCEIDDNKNGNKLLESSNKTLVDKLKDLKKFQDELDRYHDVNYASKVEINCAKANVDLLSYKMESQKSFNEYTQKINDLNQIIS